MTSREIEGENPLYLTQAKIYDKSCSIGPCIIDSESINNYENFIINCNIVRNNKSIYNSSSSVKSMNKSIPNLIKWLKKSNTLPIKSAFLTGTGIIPPPEFTLNENDQIIMVSDKGQIIRVNINQIRIAGRSTQGVSIFKIPEGDKTVYVSRVGVLKSK